MVDIVNGKNDGALAGWAIVSVGAVTLIGKQILGGTLEPVYELKAALVQTPNGPGIAHQCFPLWLLDVRHVTVPNGALVVPVESLSRDARKRLANAVRGAEEFQQGIRVADSGISLAKTLPPSKRG
jgi:hypothetical protein